MFLNMFRKISLLKKMCKEYQKLKIDKMFDKYIIAS